MKTRTHSSARHRTRLAIAAGIIAAATLTLGGCYGLRHPEEFPVDAVTPKATSNPAEITAEDFGYAWNLTVDRGSVSCDDTTAGDPVLRFTAPDGSVYALNALPENQDLPDLGELSNGSIGPIRSFAFSICEVP